MIRTIWIINAILVVLITIAAFILSYHSLLDILNAYPGVHQSWRWLWPLLLDAGMAVFALVVVAYRLQGEDVSYAWRLVVGYTIATVIFNVLSIGQFSIVGAVIAASKPVTFFFSFHLLMQMLERYTQHRQAANTLAQLKQQIADKRSLANGLAAQLDDLRRKAAAKQAELQTLQRDVSAARWMVVNESTLNEAKQILAERSDVSGSELGRLLGRSASFGRRIKRTVESESEFISLNGSNKNGS